MTFKPLPPYQRALVQREYAKPLQVETILTPRPSPGSAIIQVIVTNVLSYMGDIYNGKRKYPYPTPIVPGISAVGRVAAVGPDSVSLEEKQLVLIDAMIRGRDDPSAIFLFGLHEGGSEQSQKLMRGEWRDSTYAEYVKVPLENCVPVSENILCRPRSDGGLGYAVEKLAFVTSLLVPYGGFRDIGLAPGETVIISPATGAFGGAAVLLALAIGARVIAMGRNTEALTKLRAINSKVKTVRITGNQDEEVAALRTFGPADALLDISPPEASKSTHLQSAILSLRRGGRASLMAGYHEDVAIPYRTVMRKDIQLRGKWMYNREDAAMLVKLLESGILKLGDEDGVTIVGSYPFEEWQEAFRQAEKNARVGQVVLLHP